MNKYFMSKYAMSEKGANNLSKAIFSRTILNFTKLFPTIIAFMFLSQYLGSIEGIKTARELTFNNYLVIIVTMVLVMFIVARWDYTRLYTNVYMESSNIRVDIANRLKKLPLSYFGKRDLTDIASTMMGDITLYEEIFSHSVPHIYATTISTLVISIMLLAYNFKLGVATLWVIPISLIISFTAKRMQKKAANKWVVKNREVFDNLQESIEQIEEIKSYNLEKESLNRFYGKLSDSTKEKMNVEFVSSVSTGFANILLKLGIVSVAVVGANMFIAGEINILVYVIFLMISVSVYLPIEGIIVFMAMISTLDSVVARMKEIKTMQIQEGKTEMNPKNYDIEFQDVYFGYDDYSVINGVSFTAKQGEVTALIGESGSGKSTIAKLAARFWDIDKGKILLGGEDIGKVDPEILLKNFSIVFQDVVLFNSSIKDNIKIGKKDATEDDINRAVMASRCNEFLERMPDGIDTIIGENGERLSGGERQRISIARALLKDAPIILMDEATASLDVENESLIQEAISELIKDKTVIVIAHRMRTIRNADKIVLLKEGKIEDFGSDDELLSRSSVYRKMIDRSSK